MKAVLCFMLILSHSLMASEGERLSLEWMNYENLMAGRQPIEVHMPTEIAGRMGQKPILDLKREPGKVIKRAPAIEEIEKKALVK